jgi:DNA-binding NarL/FixJ family response regulator
MYKDIRVLIFEDGPYARDMMSLLLTRDWRTRVVGEAARKTELVDLLADEHLKSDVAIIDTEIPGKPDLPLELAALLQDLPHPPKILFTGTLANPRILSHITSSSNSGYVLKQEILYALASAVASVQARVSVVTPGIFQIAGRYGLPNGTLIMDGRKTTANFTRRENDLIRLGIIFNLAIRDIADELVLGAGWVSEIVSGVYKKLGLREILTGEIPLDLYFTDEAVLAHIQQIVRRPKTDQPGEKMRKAPWMSTLAFHMLTVPEITEI